MADRGTTGGYTKIATVSSVDLPRLAQALPGDRVSFRTVTIEEAHRALAQQEAVLQRLAAFPAVVFARRQLQVRVDDLSYAVTMGLSEQRATGRAPSRTRTEVQAVTGAGAATVHVEVVE